MLITPRVRAARVVALVALLVWPVVGCSAGQVATPGGRSTRAAPTASGPPPYAGPLDVEVTSAPTATSAERGGAAGRAVRCDGAVTGGYSPPEEYREVVSSSPTDDLERSLSYGAGGIVVPEMRMVREDGPRQLFTYELDGRPKLAVVFLHGTARDQRVGWWIETWAECDIAEFPAQIAEARGLQIWTDAADRRLPTTTIVSSTGPEHCDWQSMTFLHLGDEGRTFVSDVDAELADYFAEPYRASGPLPAEAVDAGWNHDGRHLWLDPQHRRVYVGSAHDVQTWPRTVKPLLCA